MGPESSQSIHAKARDGRCWRIDGATATRRSLGSPSVWSKEPLNRILGPSTQIIPPVGDARTLPNPFRSWEKELMPPGVREESLLPPLPPSPPKSASLQCLPVLGPRQLVLGHTNGDGEGPGHLGGVGTWGIQEASHSDPKARRQDLT